MWPWLSGYSQSSNNLKVGGLTPTQRLLKLTAGGVSVHPLATAGVPCSRHLDLLCSTGANLDGLNAEEKFCVFFCIYMTINLILILKSF